MTATATTRRRTYAAIAIASMIAPVASCAGILDEESRSATPMPREEKSAMPDNDTCDGEYIARRWYGSLPSHQDVILTIESGTVTAVEITTPAEDETSLGYQQRFAEALPDTIIGRPIDDIDVDRLAGSSGCSEGFMSALNNIRDEARAK